MKATDTSILVPNFSLHALMIEVSFSLAEVISLLMEPVQSSKKHSLAVKRRPPG
jgi:hypothetical protein